MLSALCADIKGDISVIQEGNMFKIIGAVVVYGFATYGLVTWLLKFKKDEELVKESSN